MITTKGVRIAAIVRVAARVEAQELIDMAA